MRQQRPWTTLFGLRRVLFLSWVVGLLALRTAGVAGEFVPLFNGTNLAGWHVKCPAADKGKTFWTVDAGTILCDSMGRPDHGYVWLLTDQEYGDFELRLDFQAYKDSPGNSGLQFRSRFDDAHNNGWLDGPQVDIHPPQAMPWRTGLIYDETREERRWIAPSLKDSTMDPKFKPERHVFKYAGDGDGWNQLTLVCRGTRVTTVLNGVVVTDWDGAGVLDNVAHVKHNVGRTGHFALQLHSGDQLRIRFKNILVRRLNSSARAGEQGNTEALLKAILAPDGPAGFGVHLGCGEGALTAELARSERLVVHALEADPTKVGRARELLQARGLYGRAAVEPWAESFLPYADNLVNVLVADQPGLVAEAELLRVLAPLGTLWVRRDGVWQSRQKPWPKEFDEWTHARHGADGNMVSRDTAVHTPTGLRWIAGPPQDAGGRRYYYDHVLVSSAGRSFYQFDDTIVARDAFNGRLLWRRDAKAYTFKESGTKSGLKVGTRTSKVRPVAAGNRLYAALDGKLSALDAADGQTVQELAEIEKPREIAVVDSQLLLSDQSGLRAFTLEGKLLWRHDEFARRMVAGDSKVLFLNTNKLVGLDLKTGKELWRAEHPKAVEAVTCSYYGGVLVIERSSWRDDGVGSGVVAFSSDTGELLWEKEYTPGMTHYKESRAFFAEDLVWLEVETALKPKGRLFGLDPRTGEKKKELGTRGLHCSVPVATENYLITAELEFTDLKSGAQSRARMVKSACRLPFIPGNGLLYTFPVQCECYPMLRGYMGLAQSPQPGDAASPRLQPGPAFGSVTGSSGAANLEEEWPMYRRDKYRSGSTPMTLVSSNWQTKWETAVAPSPAGLAAEDWADDPFVRGIITPPVCASGVVLLAVPYRHQVLALDAASGAVRWTYTAGGRVDTPPTISGDLCVFGAHDGYVYCLSLADGQLVWRFRAAPREARIAVYGQMESPWPVAGGLLVENGVAFFAAGRHPNTDGGLRVYALAVRDGRVIWDKEITDTGVKGWYASTFMDSSIKVGVDYEPVDLMVRDGNRVAMSRWRFAPDTGEMTLAFSRTNYQTFGSLEVPRGIWGYGIRQNKLVWNKPPAVFNARGLTRGATNDTALLLAGDALVKGGGEGEIVIGGQTVKLESAPVHEGLVAAYGRIYAATRQGKVYCLGARD